MNEFVIKAVSANPPSPCTNAYMSNMNALYKKKGSPTVRNLWNQHPPFHMMKISISI